MDEKVVLVDENNNALGEELKEKVHHSHTPLHRGFSVFLFNNKGELLLQKRASTKITFPGVCSNSCCGHPALGENVTDAGARRLEDELGLHSVKLAIILPDFRYRVEMNGVWENEICPVMVGITKEQPMINKEEVEETKWIDWAKFLEEVEHVPDKYSPWSGQEAKLLASNSLFKEFYEKICR